VLQEWNEKRKSRQRKNCVNQKTALFAFQYSQDSKRKIELRAKSAKQVANSYFYTWKKTKEENNNDNNRLLYLLAPIVRSRYS